MSRSRSFARAHIVLAGLASLTFAPLGHAQSTLSTQINYLGLDDVEITPNQRYAVVRQNRSDQYALVFDLTTGQVVASPSSTSQLCGDCVDAVATTNTRAVVLGGDQATILDLTQIGIGNPVIAQPSVGYRPNDVAITPDGNIAVIRGGSTLAGGLGGSYLYELQGGTQIGFHAGEPPQYDYSGVYLPSYDTDSVAVTNQFAVVLSAIGSYTTTTPATAPSTRVTIWNLNQGVGAPFIAFESGGLCADCADLPGAPHDVAITPDGLHAVVRSELRVGLYALNGASTGPVWSKPLSFNLGFFLDEALDSVEVTNDRIVTLSRLDQGASPSATQVDFFDMAGNQMFSRITGSPHDLGVSPDGTRALVRTRTGVFLYDITTLSAAPQMPILGSFAAPSSTYGYQEGLDSVAINNRYAVTTTHLPNLQDMRVYFWSIARGHLDFLASRVITNSRPVDLAISPDGEKVVVTGTASISVFHLATGMPAYEHHAIGANNWYQWCDGVAVSNDKAVGIGQWGAQSGWIDIADMTPIYTRYCAALPNSTGQSGHILALGNASVSANNLKLCAEGLPPRAHGRFVYGPTQTQIPFGDGYQCVATPAYGLRFLDANVSGAAALSVNYLMAQSAAMITPGSTWNFQFIFTDQNSSGFGINSTDGLSITFVP
jgi:hypothetical protein